MLKTNTKFVKYGSEYSIAVLVPAEIRKDSAFPFKEDDELEIEIFRETFIIRKADKKSQS